MGFNSECLASGKVYCQSFHVVLHPRKPSLVRGAMTVSDHLPKPSQMKMELKAPSIHSAQFLGPKVTRSRQWADKSLVLLPVCYLEINRAPPATLGVPKNLLLCSFIHLSNRHWTCTLYSRHCGWRDDQDLKPHPNSAQAYLRDQHNTKYLTRQLRGVCMQCGVSTLGWVTHC